MYLKNVTLIKVNYLSKTYKLFKKKEYEFKKRLSKSIQKPSLKKDDLKMCLKRGMISNSQAYNVILIWHLLSTKFSYVS